MKKITYIIILVIFTYSFSIPKKLEKRITKEIISVFDIKYYDKELIVIDDEIENKLYVPFNNENFYKILEDNKVLGYYYYGTAPSKTDYFDYVVIFDNEMIIKKIKILSYREDYGGEISSKRWLKQFNDLSKDDSVVYQKDIKAISGATISARSMTISINNLLKSLEILQF
jgi:Na+-translocating ferredoxin:NAD+ oxidoreductase RnfG subunit